MKAPDLPPTDAQAYYAQSQSWADDVRSSAGRAEKRAWILVIVLGLIAAFEAIALIALVPLKTVVPYTLLVDRQTGNVEQVKPGDMQQISANSALTHSFLVQYVAAREGFDLATLQTNYRKVALMTAEPLRHAYIATMQATNPNSPLSALPPGTTISIFIKSVSDLDADHALVRYASSRYDSDGTSVPLGDFVALVAYHYSGAPLSDEQRYINPLGFTVTGYTLSREALPAVSTSGNTTQGLSLSTGSLSAAPVIAIPSQAAMPANPTAQPLRSAPYQVHP